MQRFSDFASPSRILDGEKIRIDRALNRELTILAYRLDKSKFNDNLYFVLTVGFGVYFPRDSSGL